MFVVKKNKSGKWIVIEEGKKRARKTFSSKSEAIVYAEQLAKKENKEYRVDGSIDIRKFKLTPLKVIICLILIGLLIGGGYFLYSRGYFDSLIDKINSSLRDPNDPDNPDNPDSPNNPDNPDNPDSPNNPNNPDNPSIIVEGEFSIHFLELGIEYAGDSVYIKAGDYDILIDAGSKTSSAKTIIDYVNQYCTDNKLEYVIATHAHEDHIAGFVGNSTVKGIFDTYECEVIIDYALKNTTSKISKEYEAKRDLEVANGAKHYTAADCIKGLNGASKKYVINENISFEILEQEFYYSKSSDENDYSVCLLFNYSNNYFLFTGDLEEAGEESLVELNDLPHCRLFKGGHHGSKTSSSEALLAEITPEVVCVCCCAGSSEYTKNVDNMFPTQDFINRVAKYTDLIYVTTLATYEIAKDSNGNEYPKLNGFESMNGNIVVSLDKDGKVIVNCSNNNTILKDSEWFNSSITLNGVTRKMRTWPEYGK